MARTASGIEIQGEGVVWGAGAFAASLLAGIALVPFRTTPYNALRIDSADQVVTVVLLFAGGLLASVGGRASRRAGRSRGRPGPRSDSRRRAGDGSPGGPADPADHPDGDRRRRPHAGGLLSAAGC